MAQKLINTTKLHSLILPSNFPPITFEVKMIIATIKIKVSPKRSGDMQEIMHSILGSIRGEPGLINCRFYQNVANDNEFFIITEWKSEEYLNRYIATDEYRKFIALIDISEEQPDIKFNKISKVSGMEKIAAIRLGEKSKEVSGENDYSNEST